MTTNSGPASALPPSDKSEKQISKCCRFQKCLNLYCFCLTRTLSPSDKRMLFRQVCYFKICFDRRTRRPFEYKHQNPVATNVMFKQWEMYLLLDFFVTNGPLLVGTQACAAADSENSWTTANDCLIRFCNNLQPDEKQGSLEILPHFKRLYQHAFFDYSLLASTDQDSVQRVGISSFHLMALLHLFALYGNKFRCQ